MPKKKLTKKSSKNHSGFVKVKFSRNTTKSFKLKSADLGELQSLVVEVSSGQGRLLKFGSSFAIQLFDLLSGIREWIHAFYRYIASSVPMFKFLQFHLAVQGRQLTRKIMWLSLVVSLKLSNMNTLALCC